ncbi:chromosomal replication initiator protein DnaA [candidate division WWE3 bacterium CG08_land_8_20_14_0_20_41_10]|uniref:Chromosomal replication initiator protein DnaA n=1 Tax=candidate division WWE3 bacterium CG08_land_8_20_14_0_20_41_10 TaxID=1975085 RepID=A0A2H0XBL2_UNCKA|nr:MAG: chromosomal replication initiator protein DnaA [candidate division WWE3 bacterium CG08_land_8_20_14_0_20_41_10]
MTEQEKTLWIKLSSELELSGNNSVYKIYSPRMGVKVDGGELAILCPDGHSLSVIEKAFRKLVEAFVEKSAPEYKKVDFVVGKVEHKEKSVDLNTTPLFAPPQVKTASVPVSRGDASTNGGGNGLSARYVFENYLMGSNNQLAYAVAKAVAESPGESYNPLFIHSGIGLGKTHLMQAIGNKIVAEKPHLKVIYSTGEAFMNELVEAIQTSKGRGQYTVNKFRAKFRTADVLLIDDVQVVAGRESTQEEFFHTFNTLYMAQKQIVLTSDRPPKDFVNLEERVRSRFGSGMIVDIKPPDLDMRIAILRNRRDEAKDSIQNDALDVIALTISSNIRELLASYMQVVTDAKSKGVEPDKKFTAETLGQRVVNEGRKPVNLQQILRSVCNYYSVKADDIKGHKRTRELVIPRHIAMYLIYDLTKTPYMSIGDFLGGRDHTTILHGVRKVEEELKEVAKTKQDITNIMQSVYAK